ncbi:MAG: hypothetical protein OHK0019_37200 [Saprospiraceae bacterium]
MSNTINLKQKDESIQRMFAAQAQIYTEAKKWMMFRFWVSLFLSLYPVGAYFSPYLSSLEWTAVVPALLVSFVFPFLFRDFEQKKVATAASIQQKIDLTLYEIPWDDEKDGLPPLKQVIEDADSRYKDERDRFRPWYEGVSDIWSLERASLYCQNQNLWWDAEQRAFFQKLFLWLGLAALLLPLCFASSQNLFLTEYEVKYLLPTLPLLQFCFEKWEEQRKLSEKQSIKAAEINALMESEIPITRQMIRNNQDFIFEIRKGTALVPDRIYKWLKKRLSGIVEKSNQHS